jgi:hypothetical protein
MSKTNYQELFSAESLDRIFPIRRTNQFFEALLGDVDEGAYDIHVRFRTAEGNQLFFELQLTARPGKCLACNLTYGLPDVFKRHPIINLAGLVTDIESQLEDHKKCMNWRVGVTQERHSDLHIIPLIIDIEIPQQ